MKKLITLIIALSALAAFSNAAPERMRGLERQLDRITSALDDTESDLSEQKRFFLESRREMLSLQLEVRDAVRDALADLPEDHTKEDVEAVREEIRDQYREEFEAFKEERRTERRERKGPRETVES